ncbi:MAG: hypothetical protein ACJ71W_14410 [Terriglobales bacterium]
MPVDADKIDDRKHEFHFKGEQDKKKNHAVTLAKDGLLPASSIGSVNAQFNPFTGKAVADPKIDSFITVKLPPAPDQITFFSSVSAVMKGTAGEVKMPLDHVLVYKVADISKVKMTYNGVDLKPDKTGANSGQFHLQVGLPKGDDPNGDKGVKFFNERLLAAFPNSGVKELVKITSLHTEGTDVECKNGGLLLTQAP